MAKRQKAASPARTKKRKLDPMAVAVEHRLREERDTIGLRRQAEHWVADAGALEAEATRNDANPSRQQRRASEQRRQKLETCWVSMQRRSQTALPAEVRR